MSYVYSANTGAFGSVLVAFKAFSVWTLNLNLRYCFDGMNTLQSTPITSSMNRGSSGRLSGKVVWIDGEHL